MPFDIQSVVTAINNQITSLDFERKPKELYEPIKYILSLGGKRMRPLMTVLGCYLFDDNYQKALRPALAVEVFHNFTLVHDDIMDGAPLRRGKPTVHKKWNDNVAILSGDAMMMKAYELLMDIEGERYKLIHQLFNQCAVEVCEGQQLDMNFEKTSNVSEAEYLYMIRLKTAVLLGFSLEMGALIGGASVEEAKQLRDFGLNMGIGFQLKDDLLDVYGDKEKFGKQVGGDIIANKKTFLLIKALEEAEQGMLNELQTWLNKTEFNKEEKVKAVTGIFDKLNIKEKTTQKMNAYFEAAFKALDIIEVTEQKKQLLIQFAEGIIHREK